MSPVLGQCKASVSHLKHIRIIPVSRTRISSKGFILIHYIHNRDSVPLIQELLRNSVEIRPDITGSSPGLSELRHPLPRIGMPPLTDAQENLPAGGLESIARNINHKSPDLRFFEFGNCYYFHAENKCADIIPGVSKSTEPEVIKHVLDAYSEDYHMALWLTGKKVSGSWAHADEASSIYELKAYVLNIFARLGVNMASLVVVDGKSDIFSKSVEIQNRGGKVLAVFGIVSKKLQKAFDIANEVYYADINWKLAMKAIKNNKVSYKEISKFPAVSRDLALLVDKNVEFAAIEEIAYKCEKKLLKDVKLFDVYEGKNLEAGKKSYAVNFTLQDEQKTLNDKQIDAIMNKIIDALTKQLDAKLR